MARDFRETCSTASLSQPAPGYSLSTEGNAWKAECVKQKLRLRFTQEEIQVLPTAPVPTGWELGISLIRFGGSEDLRPAGLAFLTASGDRAEYQRGRMTEWFRNAPAGIEHGLDIPEGTGSPILQFDFRVTGILSAKVSEDGQRVAFLGPSGTEVLSHQGLSGLDDREREVALRWERLEPTGGSDIILRLSVHAADHAYPLRVLAHLTTPKGASGSSHAGSGSSLEASILSVPANDTCGAAEVIPGAGPFPFDSSVLDLTDATTTGDPPTPSCQTDISRSVWFSFTPATSASYSFSVCSCADRHHCGGYGALRLCRIRHLHGTRRAHGWVQR